MTKDSLPLPERREFLGKLAAGAVALGLTGTATTAFASERKKPADMVPSDKWLSALTGKHRQFFDMPNHENGMGLIHVRNYLNTMRDTYHVQHPEVTAVVGLYGMSTMLGFNDAMWKKYGKAMPPVAAIDDPKTKQRPDFNIYYDKDYGFDLPNLGATISEVQKKGVHFAVCQMATRFFAGNLAQATGGTADATYTELVANLVPNSHMVAAGIVAVNRAQERGFTLATAI